MDKYINYIKKLSWKNSKEMQENAIMFLSSVNDWDYKNQKGTIYESGKYNNYFFNGEIITGDAPGNINYGYVGKAAWWASEKLLFKQAGKAQKAAGTSLPEWDKPPYYGDDPNDYNMIKKGIQLYEKRNK